MNMVIFYYSNIIGYYPKEEESIIKTKKTISYLKDCGFNDRDIAIIMLEIKNPSEAFTYNLLPDKLWNNSLIEKGKFYFHKRMRITSLPPTVKVNGKDVCNKFFVEMLIKLTEKDILEYFYEGMYDIPKDEKRDIAQVRSVLKRLEKYIGVEKLDIFFKAIDMAKEDMKTKGYSLYEIFDIKTEHYVEAYKLLKSMKEEAKIAGADKWVLR